MTTPNRTLLNIYQPNRIRLDSLTLPITMTLTKWINEAISEKLDKALPHTAGVSPMVEKPVSAVPAFDPMAERRRLLRLQRGPDYVGEYSMRYKGTTPYDQAEHEHNKLGSGSPGIEALIEDRHIREGIEMSTEEKGAIWAAHALKQKQMAEKAEKDRVEVERVKAEMLAEANAPQVSPHAAADAKFEAMQKAKHEKWLAEREAMEEAPLINVAAPAMEDDADFWGEADEAAYHKIKAKARKA